LSPSFGRGAMTNSWQDMQNSECFLIAGSNCAECHPIAMKWVNRARAKGAKVIVVDPRFTRTASQADIFAQIRPGTDIAYLGAMINYYIENRLYNEFYVMNFTNALYKISKDFKFNDGLFSGFNPETRKYDYASWAYQLDAEGKPVKAASLDDPDCVFQKLKAHYSRYTFDVASKITGIPVAKIKLIADTFAAANPGNIFYALGMTQHTTATQGIRCYAIIQLLLGNVGKAGGGIQALRGEPNVQGSTDMANLNANLPGYLPYPTNADKTLQDYVMKNGSVQHKPLVALLKAWFGKNATAENDYGYQWLPKNNPSNMPIQSQFFSKMEEGQFKLLLNWGSNSTVSIPDRKLVARGLSKLEMLVVADIFNTETAQFWSEEGLDPAKIPTEVVFLPAAFVYEKAGSMTNSSRLIQWKEVALKPLNDVHPDLDMLDHIFKKVRALYAGSTDPKDEPILKANWDYGPHEAEPLKVLQELGGYNDTTGKPIASIGEYLAAPVGAVSTGCWIYTGVTPEGQNLADRRGNDDPTGLGLNKDYAFAWPGNIRVLYNRASCDAYGQPVDSRRKLIWWDPVQNLWVGNDGPDVADKTKGPDTPEGKMAFRMNPEGVGRLFTATYKSGAVGVPTESLSPVPIRGAGMTVDGPMPEFYEPIESPTANLLHPEVQNNPCAKIVSKEFGKPDAYPYVLTTYGVVEHFCAGAITRNIPWLNEIAPEPYAEISKNLAHKIGVEEGDKVEVSSARGKLVVRALVTDRIQTLKINGKDQETIGMPWSWGFASLNPGPSTNNVTMNACDPGAGTPEYKCCLVNIRRA
jgi:formate dehydrogenase major subunit